MLFWQAIAGFCYLSNQSWSQGAIAFSSSSLLTPTVICKELTEIKARAALDSTVVTVRSALFRSLLTVQRTTVGNEFVSGLGTNFYTHFIKWSMDLERNITISPRRFNDCSCSNMNGCPHPSVTYNRDGQLITIPGLVTDCLIVDGALASTLECYYDRTCLSNLHKQTFIDVDLLLTGLNKHFSPNSTVQELLNELMIDNLSIEITFDSLYAQCNPSYCSYSYSHRFDILYIITTITGIFGGFSSILYLIAPFIVRKTV